MMSKRRWKYGLAALALACLVLASGCKNDVQLKLTTGLNQGELFRIENRACTEAEARLFLMNQKNRYEASYGEKIWDVPMEGENFADYMKEQLKDFLAQLKCMVLMAENRGISLSEEEERLTAQAAQEYFAALGEEASAYINMTEDQLTALYREYRLADRLVAQVTAAVASEISDDEARVIEVQQVVLYREKEDEDGGGSSLSDSETEALRGTARNVAERAAAGDAFSNLQEIYSDEEPGSIRVSRYDVAPQWEEAVFALGNGEVSGVIETDEAFYVVRCVNNLLTEETMANKEVIRERQRAEMFYREYDAFTVNLVSQYDAEGWRKISFTDEVPNCDADFYAVYDKYFP